VFPTGLAPPTGSVEALQNEIDGLREKLVRAQEREYVHQTRWAEEVDQLRLKLAALEPLAKEARVSRSSDQLCGIGSRPSSAAPPHSSSNYMSSHAQKGRGGVIHPFLSEWILKAATAAFRRRAARIVVSGG
jgi:hypothetical protein